jgi:hypothetical protein
VSPKAVSDVKEHSGYNKLATPFQRISNSLHDVAQRRDEPLKIKNFLLLSPRWKLLWQNLWVSTSSF